MTLLQAVVNGNGTMAQLGNWELGGNGQWMQGGMTMVGDMFNYGLKAKVCTEVFRRGAPKGNRWRERSSPAVQKATQTIPIVFAGVTDPPWPPAVGCGSDG
jgi:hypothetical protein